MLRQMIRSARLAAVLLTAVLLSLCFPSGSFWWLAWISFVPLIVSAAGLSLPSAFGCGYAAGFLFFSITLFWIHHVTSLGLVLLSAYLAFYWAVFTCAAAWSSSWMLWRRAFFLASLWVVLEYVRAHAFTGFGWAALAHTQSRNLVIIQIADIAGTYGVAWIMMAVNVVAAVWGRHIVRRQGIPFDMWRTVAMIGAGVFFAAGYGTSRLAGMPDLPSLRVAVVQGNISLADYADPLLKPFVVGKYLALSQEAVKQSPALIIWPETSFPQFVWDQPALFEKVRIFARDNRVPVLLGLVTRSTSGPQEYFNSAVLVDEHGALDGRYNKQHLVLFGEYIPFRAYWPFLAQIVPVDDFTAGKGNAVFKLGDRARFSCLICFEDTVPGLARRSVRDDIGFMVNMTNDAWFGRSRQPWMHLDNAVFRAVETRHALVRATNTGISCTILPTGEIRGRVADVHGHSVMAEGFSVMDVPLNQLPDTFYTKYGDIFAMLCFLGILGLPFRQEGHHA